MPSLRAAIFDWDGVIIDSHEAHECSWALLAGELGHPFSHAQFKATFGMRNEQIIPDHLKWAEPGDHGRIAALGDRKEALYREIIRNNGITPLPGVVDLLASLAAAGIPCAVGSSTPRENIECVMEIIGVADRFQAVTAAADVARGKPHPDVFLACADKLNTPPADCVVFEDAQVGIRAAKAGGMKAVAVTTTHPADAFSDCAPDLVVENLAALSLDRLRRLFA